MTTGIAQFDLDTGKRIARATRIVEDIPFGVAPQRRRRQSADGGGDTYNGYFNIVSTVGNVITVGAGKAKIGNDIIDIGESDVTATGQGFIVAYFLPTGGASSWSVTIQFITDFSALANGMDYDLLHTVEFSGDAVTSVDRQKTGWAFPTGKAV